MKRDTAEPGLQFGVSLRLDFEQVVLHQPLDGMACVQRLLVKGLQALACDRQRARHVAERGTVGGERAARAQARDQIEYRRDVRAEGIQTPSGKTPDGPDEQLAAT